MSKNKVKIQKRKDFWERNEKTNGYLLKKKIGEIGFKFIRALLLKLVIHFIIHHLETELNLLISFRSH